MGVSSKLRHGIQLAAGWLRLAVTRPFQELNRWQRMVRFAYDLGGYGARQLREDRAPQMAAALAFRTLFGLAPVLVVGMILVKAVKGLDALLVVWHELLVGAGLDEIQVVAASKESLPSGQAAVTLADWLAQLTGQLAQTNLAGIGWVGSLLIVYAAIGLMATIENSFNIIYRAPGGRPWTRRVPLYWFILTVGPVLVGVAAYVNDQFSGWIATVDAWHWVLLTAQFAWGFGVVWLFVFVVYTLVPNSTVALRPALVGALVATVLIWIGKHTLGMYLGSAFAVNQLYSSLGLVPLFMFWVYLMWLAVLFGLQVGATLQVLRGRTLDELDPPRERTGIVDPVAVLTVMEIIGAHFSAGRPSSASEIAEASSIPERTVVRIVQRLVRAGWLHHVEQPGAAVTLAKPPDQIDARALMQIGFEMADENSPGRCSALGEQLRRAQRAVLDGKTLATLLRGGSQPMPAQNEPQS